MKKAFLIFAIALVACSAFAATVASFSPADGGVFKLSQGGKLTRVEAFSPVTGGTVALDSIWSADAFTNAVEISVFTNVTFEVVKTNFLTHAIYTNIYPNLSFENDPDIVAVATNAAVVATTNSWPVWKETVSVTNAIFSGTQTGYVYTNSLASPLFLAPGEKLRFVGTGVGGFVRLIFE